MEDLKKYVDNAYEHAKEERDIRIKRNNRRRWTVESIILGAAAVGVAVFSYYTRNIENYVYADKDAPQVVGLVNQLSEIEHDGLSSGDLPQLKELEAKIEEFNPGEKYAGLRPKLKDRVGSLAETAKLLYDADRIVAEYKKGDLKWQNLDKMRSMYNDLDQLTTQLSGKTDTALYEQTLGYMEKRFKLFFDQRDAVQEIDALKAEYKFEGSSSQDIENMLEKVHGYFGVFKRLRLPNDALADLRNTLRDDLTKKQNEEIQAKTAMYQKKIDDILESEPGTYSQKAIDELVAESGDFAKKNDRPGLLAKLPELDKYTTKGEWNKKIADLERQYAGLGEIDVDDLKDLIWMDKDATSYLADMLQLNISTNEARSLQQRIHDSLELMKNKNWFIKVHLSGIEENTDLLCSDPGKYKDHYDINHAVNHWKPKLEGWGFYDLIEKLENIQKRAKDCVSNHNFFPYKQVDVAKMSDNYVADSSIGYHILFKSDNQKRRAQQIVRQLEPDDLPVILSLDKLSDVNKLPTNNLTRIGIIYNGWVETATQEEINAIDGAISDTKVDRIVENVVSRKRWQNMQRANDLIQSHGVDSWNLPDGSVQPWNMPDCVGCDEDGPQPGLSPSDRGFDDDDLPTKSNDGYQFGGQTMPNSGNYNLPPEVLDPPQYDDSHNYDGPSQGYKPWHPANPHYDKHW